MYIVFYYIPKMFPGSVCDKISSPAVWDLMGYNLKCYHIRSQTLDTLQTMFNNIFVRIWKLSLWVPRGMTSRNFKKFTK